MHNIILSINSGDPSSCYSHLKTKNGGTGSTLPKVTKVRKWQTLALLRTTLHSPAFQSLNMTKKCRCLLILLFSRTKCHEVFCLKEHKREGFAMYDCDFQTLGNFYARIPHPHSMLSVPEARAQTNS